nr:pentatricopeptide repeat-containing protein At3g20730-like isoform X2 [Coffea arabica]
MNSFQFMIIGTNLKEGTRFLLLFLTGHANKFPIYQSRLMPRYASLRSTATSPCTAGKLREALAFFSSGPRPPDYSFYLKLLQLCIGTNAERQGHSTHGHLIINGFRSNIHLNTKLIIFYSKLGDMVNARKVSDNMLERSVVSWTALISGYSQNGELEEALKVFSEMHKDGVRSNQYTYGSALRACTGLVCLDRGKQIQACAQKSRFVENLFVQSALVDLYSKCGRMEDAFSVFSSMMERDLVSWNAIIGGFVIQGFHDNAFYMFHLMLREGLLPDYFTFGNVLRACVGSVGLGKVGLVHGFIIKLGFASHSSLTGSLIDAYVKCGSVDNARHLYKNMQNKDIISCTALITGYAHNGKNINEAVQLFNEVRLMHVAVDNIVLCSLLSTCANTASLLVGKQIHCLALKYPTHKDVAMGNALIDMYSKSGEIGDAKHIFDEMEEKNIITWTTLITGFGRNGYGNEAVSLYKKLEDEGLKPNYVTLLSLLSACSHSGLTGEGWTCFNKMVSNYNISPTAAHYSCLVDLFARRGYLEEAYTLMQNMNIEQNATLWSTILGGCYIHGNTYLGEVAAKHLVKVEPENSANYVVIAGMYAAAGLWDSSRMSWKSMEQRSLLKAPGCSCFESASNTVALPSP